GTMTLYEFHDFGEQQSGMEKAFVCTFANKRTAHAIQVQRGEELPNALGELGIAYPCPAIVLIGGAGGIGEDELVHLHRLFREVLVPLAEVLGAAMVDGGTDA